MHDNRYLFFKNKLQALWVKTNVLEAMNKEVVKNEVCKKEKESKNFGFTSKFKKYMRIFSRNTAKAKRNGTQC